MSKHKVVVGLGYGDEGKGTMVDYFASTGEYQYVVRFSGGAQAAHNVVTPDGKHHTFSQLGSGSFHGLGTILTKDMLFNPYTFLNEYFSFTDYSREYPKVLISESALVTTPYHILVNKIKERKRGNERHGSCLMGIGETRLYHETSDFGGPTISDLLGPDFYMHIRDLRWYAEQNGATPYEMREAGEQMHNYLTCLELIQSWGMVVPCTEILDTIRDNSCIFEGSQGILLDEWFGTFPHNTWSTTTSEKALELLGEAGVARGDVEVVGVTRTYGTRHGDGPMTMEWDDTHFFPEPHNSWGEGQGGWRVGTLDLSLMEYAVRVDGNIDSLAVTHMDVAVPTPTFKPISPLWAGAPMGKTQEELEKRGEYFLGSKTSYMDLSVQSESWIRELFSLATDKQVRYASYGPTYEDKVEFQEVLV